MIDPDRWPIEAAKREIQSQLKHYSTREETQALQTQIAQAETRTIKWMVGTIVAVGAVVVTAIGIAAAVIIAVLN